MDQDQGRRSPRRGLDTAQALPRHGDPAAGCEVNGAVTLLPHGAGTDQDHARPAHAGRRTRDGRFGVLIDPDRPLGP